MVCMNSVNFAPLSSSVLDRSRLSVRIYSLANSGEALLLLVTTFVTSTTMYRLVDHKTAAISDNSFRSVSGVLSLLSSNLSFGTH